MKIWVDDSRPAPIRYIWCKSANEAIGRILDSEIRISMLKYRGSWLKKILRNFLSS